MASLLGTHTPVMSELSEDGGARRSSLPLIDGCGVFIVKVLLTYAEVERST